MNLKDVLTIEEIDSFWLATFDDVEEAKKYAEKNKGTLYTQVDSEISDDRVYSKGIHYVNRTGVYAVVLNKEDVCADCFKCGTPLTRYMEEDEDWFDISEAGSHFPICKKCADLMNAGFL